jgi:spermidine synthase
LSQWISDIVGPGYAQSIQVESILYDGRSAFQHIQVATSPLFGRMLILDHAVQTTEADEFIYHEMLVHPAMVAHPGPRRVLIIGGGDGGTLEEVLKHPVEHVTMVEIDRDVVEISRAYLPSICGEAFKDARVRLVIGDGIAFVQQSDERFDVILVDSTDPKGPGVALFSEAFYRACARALTNQGVLVAQSGSYIFQRSLTDLVRSRLEDVFPLVVTYWAAIPAYPGVLWSFTCGSTRHNPGALPEEQIAHRLTPVPTRYYRPGMHRVAFTLPPQTGA